MRKIIVIDVPTNYEVLKGQIGTLETDEANSYTLYKIQFKDTFHYLYRNEFEYLDEYLLKYWLED